MEGDGGNEGTAISSQEEEQQQVQHHDELFVWDENSHLYFHARSGFYHDPNAGWYYSSRDGLYYKFEDGNYVLLDSYQGDQSGNHGQDESVLTEGAMLIQDCEGECGNTGRTECSTSEAPENPPPPSEWLEDTLIELYLSGYSNVAADVQPSLETDEREDSMLPANGNDDAHELEEGEWSNLEPAESNDASWDEESWRAQYGQVVQTEEESVPGSTVVDMWDWAKVKEMRKDGKGQTARLVGRLVQPSAQLHPSMPSGGARLKTAPICKVHLALVRVRSGQVYRLRTPSAGYLAMLSSYDASNPTKDWGFPELSAEERLLSRPCFIGSCESKMAPLLPSQPSSSIKQESHAYRDRASERRALHGGFGVGPGQKKTATETDEMFSAEEAAAESMDISFGDGSYARRILKNMGWTEGEALGKTKQGLKKPLEAVGNKGTAGLGWSHGRSR